jgi:chromosome segregation ATPase
VPLHVERVYLVGKAEQTARHCVLAGSSTDCACTEREVKKANREIQSLLNNMDGAHSQLQLLQKKYNELLSDMKRMEREHSKAKKRGDQLQKEKDAQRSELTKVTTMKDKLDKLSRDFAKENKKLKDELHKLENSESTARHELHTRLETLIAEVDDCIRVAEGPERQDERDIELDEVYVALHNAWSQH